MAFTKAYPLRILAQGAFVGNILNNGVLLVVAFLLPSPRLWMFAIISPLVCFIIFLFYSNALLKIGKGVAGFCTVCFGVGFVVVYVGGFITAALNPSMNVVGAAMMSILVGTLACGWFVLYRLNDRTRNLLQGHYGGVLSRSSIEAYCGFPPQIQHVRKDKRAAYMYFILSTVCFVGPVMSITIVPQVIFQLDDIKTQLIWIASGIVAFFGLSTLANVFLDIAKTKSRLSIKELIGSDPRKPVVFLRAFQDDQVILPDPQHTILGDIFALGRAKQSLDELLLDEGTLHGPVVALGNPKEKTPPYGAARGYFEDQDWQSAVSNLANEAKTIVLCYDETDAIRWEIKTIARGNHVSKTMFLLPPKFGVLQENRRVLAKICDSIGLDRNRPEIAECLAEGGVVGFFFGDAGSIHIGRSSTLSRYSYLAMLRLFFHLKAGPNMFH